MSLLPEGVEEVRLRSDTAGYQHDLLRYCEKGENERFGRIEFAIGCDVTSAFKSAVLELEEKDWHPIYKDYYNKKQKTNQQWADVITGVILSQNHRDKLESLPGGAS